MIYISVIITNMEWNDLLSNKDWSSINDYEDVDSMVIKYTKLVDEVLDEIAPINDEKFKKELTLPLTGCKIIFILHIDIITFLQKFFKIIILAQMFF